MTITATHRSLSELMPLHELYRAYANCQVVRDSYWSRGFADAFVLEIDGRVAGHGAVANRYDQGTVIEFYTSPSERRHALPLFAELLRVSGATRVAAQTNIPLMLMMLVEFANGIKAETVLFSDAETSCLTCPEPGSFRHAGEDGVELHIFEHHHEPVGDWVIEADGRIVATGGFLTHYNPPYADLYMEVEEPNRGRGYGAYLIQELKRVCYESGKRPAARCDIANAASRRTLEKAGLQVCGHILTGDVAPRVR